MKEKKIVVNIKLGQFKKLFTLAVLTLLLLIIFVNAQTVSSDDSDQAAEILEDSPIEDNSKKNESSLEESYLPIIPPLLSSSFLISNNSIPVQNSSNNLSDLTSDSLTIFPIGDPSVDDLTENGSADEKESANGNGTPVQESSVDNLL